MGIPNYVNWIFGEPDMTQSQFPGHSCGAISADFYNEDRNWGVLNCNVRSVFTCQVGVGRQCPDGWDFIPNGLDGKCVNFYLGGGSHLPWYDAYQYCESIGSRLLLIENEKEQELISQHFNEWERAGVSRLWLRISDLSDQYKKPNEYCDWTNYDYSQWSTSEPKCRENSNSCAYAATSGTSNNWHADYCTLAEAFACQVQPGRMIHSIEKPTYDHHCRDEAEWHTEWVLNPNNNKCYRIGQDNIQL